MSWFDDMGNAISHPFDLNKNWTFFQHVDPAITNIVPGLMSAEDKGLSSLWKGLGSDDMSNMFSKDSDNAGRGLRHRAAAALAYLAGSGASGGTSGGGSSGSSGFMNGLSNYWDKARYNVGDWMENGGQNMSNYWDKARYNVGDWLESGKGYYNSASGMYDKYGSNAVKGYQSAQQMGLLGQQKQPVQAQPVDNRAPDFSGLLNSDAQLAAQRMQEDQQRKLAQQQAVQGLLGGAYGRVA